MTPPSLFPSLSLFSILSLFPGNWIGFCVLAVISLRLANCHISDGKGLKAMGEQRSGSDAAWGMIKTQEGKAKYGLGHIEVRGCAKYQ